MRVLLVTHGYPPESVAGTEVYVEAFARALTRAGAEVTVLARRLRADLPELSVENEEREGVRIRWVNNTFAGAGSFRATYRNDDIRSIGAALLRELRPDVMHVHHLTGLSTDLIHEATSRQIPVVVTLHDYWLLCQRGQLLNRALRRCAGPSAAACAECLSPALAGARVPAGAAKTLGPVFRQLSPSARQWVTSAATSLTPWMGAVDSAMAEMEVRLSHVRDVLSEVAELWVPSETMRHAFSRFGIPDARMRTTPLGIERSRFRRRERHGRSPLRLGFVGTLMVSKAPHVLLEAQARLGAKLASVDLYGTISAYHGDDSYRWQLKPLLSQPGVRHHGAISPEAMPRALAELDALVVPSIWLENSPLVVREAFASGLPVVASALGGLTELVRHGENGLLFEAGDSFALEGQLRRLLDEPRLLHQLSMGVPPVRHIDEDATQALTRYSALGRPRSKAPARHVVGILLNHRTPGETIAAARSIEHQVDGLVAVDNGSQDGSATMLRRGLPRAQVLDLGVNTGFATGVNHGIEAALSSGASHVFLLNSDARAWEGCVAALLAAQDERCGITGPFIWKRSEPGALETRGIVYDARTGRVRLLGHGEQRERLPTSDVHPGAGDEVDAVSGCAMLLRRDVLERVGRFTDDYFFAFEDLDFCLRARAEGFIIRCVAEAGVMHEGSLTIGKASASRLYYATRNHLNVAAKHGAATLSARVLRGTAVASLNLAHALKQVDVPKKEAIAAWTHGVVDHLRRTMGPLQA